MAKTRTTQQIVDAAWSWDEQPGLAGIQAAAAVEIARAARGIEQEVSSIRSLLASVGSDGIHTLIREAKDEAETKGKRRRRAARLRAEKKRALKRAA